MGTILPATEPTAVPPDDRPRHQHNPVIAAQYARKRAAGKSPMNALGHCMRKALSIVWGVWRNGQDFDPKWGLEA
jgi:transposase